MSTYRAAMWTDGRSDVVLTLPEHADLRREDLMDEAHAEAERVGLDLSTGEIIVADWHSMYSQRVRPFEQ